MGTYIPFTEEQKLRAGAVDLEEFLCQRGEKLIRSGRDKRTESDHSVTVRSEDHVQQRRMKNRGSITKMLPLFDRYSASCSSQNAFRTGMSVIAVSQMMS